MMIWILGLLATQTLPLEPVGPWEVSANWVGCQVVRIYGPEKNIQFGFEAGLTGRGRYILVAGPKKLLPNGIQNIDVAFDDKPPIKMHYGSFKINDNHLTLLKIFPSDADLLLFSNSSSITFEKQLPPMKVRGIGAALGALDKCTTDLLTSWGADPALYVDNKMATITGDPSQWFSHDNYPKEALAKGISGRVTLLIKTRPDGSVDECKAVVSDDVSLDAGSCAIAVKRGRFKPPLDAAGNAMASYAVLPVSWSTTG
jgi:TonB family protein